MPTSEIYSAFLVEEEGTASSLRALLEVIAHHGLFCSLYTDRGSHYFTRPRLAAASTGSIDQSAARWRSSASSTSRLFAAARGRRNGVRTLRPLPRSLRWPGSADRRGQCWLRERDRDCAARPPRGQARRRPGAAVRVSERSPARSAPPRSPAGRWDRRRRGRRSMASRTRPRSTWRSSALTGPIEAGRIDRLRKPIAARPSASTGRPASSPQKESGVPVSAQRVTICSRKVRKLRLSMS